MPFEDLEKEMSHFRQLMSQNDSKTNQLFIKLIQSKHSWLIKDSPKYPKEMEEQIEPSILYSFLYHLLPYYKLNQNRIISTQLVSQIKEISGLSESVILQIVDKFQHIEFPSNLISGLQ